MAGKDVRVHMPKVHHGMQTQLRAAVRYSRRVNGVQPRMRLNRTYSSSNPPGWVPSVGNPAVLLLTIVSPTKFRVRAVGAGFTTLTLSQAPNNLVTIPVLVT